MCLPASAWQPSLCAITLSNVQSLVSSEARNYSKPLLLRGVVGPFLCFYLSGAAVELPQQQKMEGNKSLTWQKVHSEKKKDAN